MAFLPDVYSWIKLVDPQSGEVVPQGTSVQGDVIVRYVVANDSHKPAGPLTVVGTLKQDDVPVKPHGLPVVPATTITLAPNQLWKREYVVKWALFQHHSYEARLLADVGNFAKEESEKNNSAVASFSIDGGTIPVVVPGQAVDNTPDPVNG